MTSVDLAGNGIDDGEFLAQFSALRELDLQGNPLRTVPSLPADMAKLSLASTRVDASEVVHALARLRGLTSLDLSETPFGYGQAPAIASAIENHSALTSLDRGSSVGRYSTPAVCAALARNASLPMTWRCWIWILRRTEDAALRRVVTAMTERGFRDAVFAYFLPFQHGSLG